MLAHAAYSVRVGRQSSNHRSISASSMGTHPAPSCSHAIAAQDNRFAKRAYSAVSNSVFRSPSEGSARPATDSLSR